MSEHKEANSAMKLALEALINLHYDKGSQERQRLDAEDAIKVLEAALEAHKALASHYEDNLDMVKQEHELDYKAIGQQAYESGYTTGYMDAAIKAYEAQQEQRSVSEQLSAQHVSTECVGEPVCRMRVGQDSVTWYDEKGNITMHVDASNKVTTHPQAKQSDSVEQGEPVALTWNKKMDAVQAMLGITSGELDCLGESLLETYANDVERVYKALCTSPQQRPSRSDIKPLTDEQIKEMHTDLLLSGKAMWFPNLVRAIEAAHGITEEQL